MTAASDRAAKDTRQKYAAMMARERFHVRVGQRAQDGTAVRLLGTAASLHSKSGCCTCCHGRSA